MTKKDLQLINEDNQQSISSILSKELIPENKIEKKDVFNNVAEVFNLFGSIYGENWLRQFNNDNTRDVWAIFLWKYEKKIISDAIIKSVNDYKNFPPNLAQFKEICENCITIETSSLYKRL